MLFHTFNASVILIRNIFNLNINFQNLKQTQLVSSHLEMRLLNKATGLFHLYNIIAE